MKNLFLALWGAACLLSAQTPNLSGVWKADLQKSKLMQPPKEYLAVIEQSGPKLTEKVGMVGEHGDSRTTVTFQTDKQTISYVQGVPTRLTANWEGSALNLKTETAGHPEDGITRRYELSGNGKVLTITSTETAHGKQFPSTIVLTKQPEEAAAALRQPQETAEKRFKNVKTALKTLPASQFINQMHYFSWALGKDCQFCHVEHHFDSDDKKEKKTAREMIAMTLAINRDNFEGKPEVRCYTCHQFKGHAQSRPRFEGEPEHKEHGGAEGHTKEAPEK